MYVGSGGDGYLGPASVSGVYKTTDGGSTWAAANTGLTDALIETLWLDPSNPNTVLAGTQKGGIFRSADAGAHWSPAQTCSAIAFPVGAVGAIVQSGGVVYAGAGIG